MAVEHIFTMKTQIEPSSSNCKEFFGPWNGRRIQTSCEHLGTLEAAKLSKSNPAALIHQVTFYIT